MGTFGKIKYGTGKYGGTLTEDLASVQVSYRPRPLVHLTIGATVMKCSTQDLMVLISEVGQAEVGAGEVGD